MSRRVEAMARRVQSDPLFLAAPLAIFAHDEQLDNHQLAVRLGCDEATLTALRLCLRPRPDPLFREDVTRIAARFALDPVVLAEMVRRADALVALRRDQVPNHGSLLAARDRTEEQREAPEHDP